MHLTLISVRRRKAMIIAHRLSEIITYCINIRFKKWKKEIYDKKIDSNNIFIDFVWVSNFTNGTFLLKPIFFNTWNLYSLRNTKKLEINTKQNSVLLLVLIVHVIVVDLHIISNNNKNTMNIFAATNVVSAEQKKERVFKLARKATKTNLSK